MPVASVAERNADECHSVALCRRDERPAAFFGETRLYADDIVICAEQAVMIYEQARRRTVMQGYRLFCRRYNLGKARIFQRFGGDYRQLLCRGVMLAVVQPVRICKMRIVQSHFLGASVHHIGESLNAPRHLYGNSSRGIVCTLEHQCKKQIFHRYLFAGIEVNGRALHIHCRRRNGNEPLRRAVFERDKRGHYLCRACHSATDIFIVCIYYLAVKRHEQAAFCRIVGHRREAGCPTRHEHERDEKYRYNFLHGFSILFSLAIWRNGEIYSLFPRGKGE